MLKTADDLIDDLGGTTKVSKLTDAPLSTVHSWRKNGIPRSRLAHLKLAAKVAKLPVDFGAYDTGPVEPSTADRPTEAQAHAA